MELWLGGDRRWRPLTIGLGMLVVVLAPSPPRAQPRCVFLECGPANAPNPNPPVAPAMPHVASGLAPALGSMARPRVAGEVCQAASGLEYCASSVLAPQYGNTYGPANLVDADLKTAWVEGRPGHGEGESVVVDLKGAREVIALQVMNGYHKNEDLFRKNSRVREAELRFSDGTIEKARLADAPGVQTIDLAPRKAEWVRFTIRAVYPGTKYSDTAVTELRIVTRD
ncbi:MAG: discoidin domain-containing protein [Pseudomonadota bacterium]